MTTCIPCGKSFKNKHGLHVHYGRSHPKFHSYERGTGINLGRNNANYGGVSEEHRENLSRAVKETYEKGRRPWNYRLKGKEYLKHYGGKVWNKGLTEETDERVAVGTRKMKKTYTEKNIGQKISKILKGRPNPKWKGKLNPMKRAEVRKKVSVAVKEWRREHPNHLKGENNPAKRKEVRRKISNALKGREYPIEWRRRLSGAMKGRKWSQERKKQQSRILKGRKFSDEHKQKISRAMVGHKPTWPKSYFVKELGYSVRSSFDEEIGLILKNNNISHLGYESRVFKFNGTSYRPDFPITDKLVVEAKGYFPMWQRKKYREFMRAFPEVTLILVGGDGKSKDLVKCCSIHIPWEKREEIVMLKYSIGRIK